ncbi:unnamed protein product [Arctogadus glacialis]
MAFPEPKYRGVLRRHLLHQLCFQAGAGITEVVTEVSTREGKYAILPCGLDFPVNLKDEVFDWKKEQQEVFFYEKGKDYNNQDREGQDPQFVGRVCLLPGGLQAGKASMILSSVTQADSGVHKCIILLPTRQTDPADSRARPRSRSPKNLKGGRVRFLLRPAATQRSGVADPQRNCDPRRRSTAGRLLRQRRPLLHQSDGGGDRARQLHLSGPAARRPPCGQRHHPSGWPS